MEYIIDPKWVYALEVFDDLDIFCFLFAFGFGIAFIARLVVAWIDSEITRSAIRVSIIFAVVSAFFMVAAIMIPDKETMILMKTAELTTYSNIATVGTQVKEIIDYIVNVLSSI